MVLVQPGLCAVPGGVWPRAGHAALQAELHGGEHGAGAGAAEPARRRQRHARPERDPPQPRHVQRHRRQRPKGGRRKGEKASLIYV